MGARLNRLTIDEWQEQQPMGARLNRLTID